MNLNRHKLIQIAKPLGMTEGNFRKCLDGRKTQTRRVIKPTPVNMVIKASTDGNWYDADCVNPGVRIKPRYKVGDICYLREPVQLLTLVLEAGEDELRFADGAYMWESYDQLNNFMRNITNEDHAKLMKRKRGWDAPTTARFMLKSFARHFVEITGVRYERLQDITDADAINEGCDPTDGAFGTDAIDIREEMGMNIGTKPDGSVGILPPTPYPVRRFESLWNSINPKENTWDDNPWVWVFSFETVEATS